MELIGRTLKIYVRGKTSRSLRDIEIVGWSGKAFMGNKSHLKQLRDIPELSEAGIYFLLKDNEVTGLTEIYVGETDTASQRISQHIKKDWDTFVVFVSNDLKKSEVRYLESKLYNLAKQSVSTLKVMNENVPPSCKLKEADACAMEEFSSNMLFVLETMGLGLFSNSNDNEDQSKPIATRLHDPKNYEATQGMDFSITLPKELSLDNEYLKALMSVRNGAFVLKAGSPIRKEHNESFDGHTYFEMWKQIINSDAVRSTKNPRIVETTRDLEFKSPSAAGAMIRARATNGRTEWKRISDNKPFNECEIEE